MFKGQDINKTPKNGTIPIQRYWGLRGMGAFDHTSINDWYAYGYFLGLSGEPLKTWQDMIKVSSHMISELYEAYEMGWEDGNGDSN